MPNWCITDYYIEGIDKDLNKIDNAFKKTYGTEQDWEGYVLDELGIDYEKKKDIHLRGFILDYEKCDNYIRLVAQEAWNRTNFAELLQSKFPDINVWWKEEEPGLEVYGTNDVEGRFFPERYWVNTCINNNYNSEYFETEDEVYEWLDELTHGKVKSKEDIEAFNSEHKNSYENYIYVHEFVIEA